MNILNNIKLWFTSVFYGLSAGDDLLRGQNVENDSHAISINQEKDIHRVAPALLNGEITQEVVDLRYRDYTVAENSRNFQVVNGDNAHKVRAEITNIPPIFSGVNHMLYGGMQDTLDEKESFTLKIEYNNSVRFLLEKYCDHFSINGKEISLYFLAKPNRNLITSKPFCTYASRLMTNSTLGGEYNKLAKIWFVSYKISAVPNYVKFEFNNLIITNIQIENDELKFTFVAESVNIDDLTSKYVSESLREKYKAKAPKHIPNEIVVEEVQNVCEICGKEILSSEGMMNKSINNKFCCTDCLCKELIKKQENENSN